MEHSLRFTLQNFASNRRPTRPIRNYTVYIPSITITTITIKATRGRRVIVGWLEAKTEGISQTGSAL
jgi:hypothetical protein